MYATLRSMSRCVDRRRLFALLMVAILVVPTLGDKPQAGPRSNGIDRRKQISDHHEDELTVVSSSASSASSMQATRGCGSCKMREELKNRNLEAIKGEVLRRMGFQSAPNVTGRVLPQVPPHILAKIDQSYSGMQSDQPQFKTGPRISEEDDDFHIKTETVVTFAQQYPRLRHSWRGHDILHFQFSGGITKYYVSNATLYVYVKGAERRPAPTFHLEVFKVFKDHGDSPGLAKVSARKMTQPMGRGDWLQVDITTMVSEWFKNPRENLGFVVSGNVGGKKVVFTDTGTEKGGSSSSKVPFVEITTREAKRRTRRNLGLNCDEKMNESLCCRYPLTVDFEEFGWDFIIAPKRYEAHYCSGECPYITLQKHAHTHLLQMASPNTSGPCCAPRKMSAISMLYFDQQMNVVYGSLPGMVVDRCGCA